MTLQDLMDRSMTHYRMVVRFTSGEQEISRWYIISRGVDTLEAVEEYESAKRRDGLAAIHIEWSGTEYRP